MVSSKLCFSSAFQLITKPLFSNGIDFIYEFFNFENKFNNNNLSKLVKLLGKNNLANKIFTKIADKGISTSDY